MNKWEYCHLTDATDRELNVLGEQGWELVSVVHVGRAVYELFYFKRPLK